MSDIPAGSVLGNAGDDPGPAVPLEIIPYVPVRWPQGTYDPKKGHVLPFLDENVEWTSDRFIICSNDPTAGAGDVALSGTPTVGDVIGIRINFNGTHVDINYQIQSGNTLIDAAQAIYGAIMANSALQAVGIGAQYPSHYGQASVGITHPWTQPFTITGQSTTTATVTIHQSSAGLDAAPVFVLGRFVPERAPQVGDNIGHTFGAGPTIEAPGKLARAYTGEQFTILDPRDAHATGQRDVFVVVDGFWAPVLSYGNGVILWDAAGHPPAGGMCGKGTINLPKSGALLIDGAPTPRFNANRTSNQTMTSGTPAVVDFPNVVSDTGGYWDAANKRYTPAIPGSYTIHASIMADGAFSSGDNFNVYIFKNGTCIAQASRPVPAGGVAGSCPISIDVFLDGNDYVQVKGYLVATNPVICGNPSNPATYLSVRWTGK